MEQEQENQDLVQTGRRLSELRARVGMTQAEFSEAVGVSHRSIQNYESGKQEIPTDVVRVLRSKFGTSSDWVLYGPEAAPEMLDRFAGAAEMVRQTYERWETLISRAPIPIPVGAKAPLFNIFVEMAMRDGQLPDDHMQRAAKSMTDRIDPR